MSNACGAPAHVRFKTQLAALNEILDECNEELADHLHSAELNDCSMDEPLDIIIPDPESRPIWIH